jgi:hypothetical protein
MSAPRAERGQAAVEFVALVLLSCIALGALVSVGAAADGRAAGGFIAHHIVCAIGGRCQDDEQELVRAYGERDAATVRSLAPHLVYEPGERQLPVDWRQCRRPDCAVAPDDPALDTHHTDAHRATAFTRLIRRNGRLYVGYWLYFPDSNTALAGSDRIWERSWLLPRIRDLVSGTPDYPGYHRDDWEGAFVRVDPDGTAWIRASSHGRFNGCDWSGCRESWLRGAGWVRISRGSHSGHVPVRTESPRRSGVPPPHPRHIPLPGPADGRRRRVPVIPGLELRERTTTGEGLRLVPLETLDRRRYRPLDPGVRPPWRKRAYSDPESDES